MVLHTGQKQSSVCCLCLSVFDDNYMKEKRFMVSLLSRVYNYENIAWIQHVLHRIIKNKY